MLVVPLSAVTIQPTTESSYRDFRPVELPVPSPDAVAEVPAPVIYEGFEKTLKRPQFDRVQPQPERMKISIVTNNDAVTRTTGRSIRGIASWYCKAGVSVCHYQYGPGSMVAAACGKLRAALSNWRGKTVTVSSGGRSVQVKLVDWCGHPSRVIDLYWEPMRRLGGTGLLNVRVSW